MQAGFAGRVGVVGQCGDAQAIDAADVDDARRIFTCGRLFEKRETELCEGEDALKV